MALSGNGPGCPLGDELPASGEGWQRERAAGGEHRDRNASCRLKTVLTLSLTHQIFTISQELGRKSPLALQ